MHKQLNGTTLTRAAFFEKTKIRVELVRDVPGFGDVYLRDASELSRIKRAGSIFDGRGNRIEKNYSRRRLFEIVDQVCSDAQGTPMFTDADLEELEGCASGRLDGLLVALAVFNGDEEKKSEDESSAVEDG